jgi:GAF domain-containing protein
MVSSGDGDDQSAGSRRGQPSCSDSDQSAGSNDLAVQLSDVARLLERENQVETTLEAIVRAAVDTVPGSTYASISATRRRREVTTLASTHATARAVDAAQYETGQGPCLDSLFEQETVRLPDMATETRWPEFTRAASELGVHSMLSVQLFVDGDDLGALNLHSDHVDAFDDESEHVALLFAAHAAVAMARAQERHNLRQAVSTREVIGQAQGILMERFKVPSDRAFQILVHASQVTNQRLTKVATELARSGELPLPPPR